MRGIAGDSCYEHQDSAVERAKSNVECRMSNVQRSMDIGHWTLIIQHWTFAQRSWQRPTLPRPRDRSTIGADRLNDRVRDGNGCGPVALVASKNKKSSVIGCQWSVLTT